MNEGMRELEPELQRLPTSVLEEFQRAREQLRPQLSDADLTAWAQQGLAIARQPMRFWEAASEYFRASPNVCRHLSAVELREWARCGSSLCQDSPTLAASFFRASPQSMRHLRGRRISGWANLGRSLYAGTWKSSALAAKFFDATPALTEYLSYQELERFAALIAALSRKSSDLATECLLIGQDVLPQLGEEGRALIGMATALVETSWRDVRACFGGVPKILANVRDDQQGRFFRLAERLAREGMSNVSSFLTEGSTALGRINGDNQGYLLDLAEQLSPLSPEAVVALLRTSPTVLSRISPRQLSVWFETGMSILQQNQEGGLAFFKLESNSAEAVLETLSSSVELERYQEVLRMYCRALAGAAIDITASKELVTKNIGWVSEGSASTEGTTVYLPTVVDKYSAKEMNFALFKVVATHQVAHIEFGSFTFSFEAEAQRFPILRLEREEETKARAPVSGPRPDTEQRSRQPELPQPQPAAETGDVSKNGDGAFSTLDTGHGEQADSPLIRSDTSDEMDKSAERGFLTDMSRFFNLFSSRKLALDVFTAVEDERLDYRVKLEYPGLSPSYRRAQIDALSERPNIEELPLQQAMVEFLVRFSLQQNKGLPCPERFMQEAKAIAEVAKRVLHADATVEDSAEATIRIYDLIADLPDMEIPEEEWGELDVDETELSAEELEELLMDLRGQLANQESSSQEGESYESPPQVEYRGDFKPELAQLLSALRMQQGQQSETQGNAEMSREMLEQALANMAELELDTEAGEFNQELGIFVQNMMREAGVTPPQTSGQGQGPIGHEGEDGRSLEARGNLTSVYDEWDFRANDYKPRWCVVREKTMAEGDPQFFADTLRNYAHIITRIRRQFELIMPEMFRKIKHLPDGDEFDLDAVIESIIDRWCGLQPSEKVYWRRNKIQRDVAVAFLMDMSASTAEAIDDSGQAKDDWDAPDDPVEYMVWLRNRRGERLRRNTKRIIDLEKESTVLLITALEPIGDVYGIYGFSGYGRENVEFYVIKDIDEGFSDVIKRRIDKITPLHATRMGPAIRHVINKLEGQEARTKLLFLISDGRPQDRGYSREGVEKEYAVHDTKMALTEARRKGITPFCLTVDKAGHDYLKTMCQDMGYEVLADIAALPSRLPMLYRKLTM